MIREAINQIAGGKNLTAESAHEVMIEMMSGSATHSQIASFITAMSIKGETEQELLGFVKAMRSKCAHINAPEGSVDLCGTGGDGLNTFNISTVASFVTSAAGVPVAKHGNKSVSSKAGSADLLHALGLPFDLDPASVEKCIGTVGLGFMFAPIFHSSMRNVAEPRREIGIRTFFNIIGPMTNPACVKHQLIGVYDFGLANRMANVLRELGTEHALIVNGNGMDEISIIGKTQAIELQEGDIRRFDISPDAFGFDLADISDISGGGPLENARLALSILRGGSSPRHDAVALNAGAAIYVSGKASSLEDGVKIASETIRSGLSLRKLEEYSDLVTRMEKERQERMEIKELRGRILDPEVLSRRRTEISSDILRQISEIDYGKQLLENLDDEIIAGNDILSVIVLSRALRVLKEGVPALKVGKRSSINMSDAIEAAKGIAVIAEYKPRSPSSHPLSVPPDPNAIAEIYSESGINCVSILTEPDFFSGTYDLFSQFRSKLSMPILFKDFVIDTKQLDIAGRLGADAVLLIAKALTQQSLDYLVRSCIEHGMEPLVEVHDEGDLKKLSNCGLFDKIRLIGVNSRNFSTLEVDLSRLPKLRDMLPSDKILIAESGIRSPQDLSRLIGFDAVLVGSLFMQSNDPKNSVEQLLRAARETGS